MLRESQEQELFINYCNLKGIKCVAIPNGFYAGKMRNKFAYINAMKRQGLRVGFPDLMILKQNKGYGALFIEFKREKGGVISDNQKEWIEWLTGNGYCAEVAHGCNEAIDILENYLQV